MGCHGKALFQFLRRAMLNCTMHSFYGKNLGIDTKNPHGARSTVTSSSILAGNSWRAASDTKHGPRDERNDGRREGWMRAVNTCLKSCPSTLSWIRRDGRSCNHFSICTLDFLRLEGSQGLRF
ncbi:hypothetical protein ARMGADRAFT_621713 [Armillaria gallica]|uniref:Uncharacterized protein n=1 Tax=Armillaria gallica TaxID=47427 RepID=A0A2H3CR76_ARMGA|nr:hypothetical protein ARMGADRAFT_621713 [Armillaria gallica]